MIGHEGVVRAAAPLACHPEPQRRMTRRGGGAALFRMVHRSIERRQCAVVWAGVRWEVLTGAPEGPVDGVAGHVAATAGEGLTEKLDAPDSGGADLEFLVAVDREQ